MTETELSLRLEQEFGKFYAEIQISADDFRINPTESIKNGLLWMMCKNIISKDDYLMMCQEYNFGESKLYEIADDSFSKERLEELLKRLHCLKN